MKKKKKAKGICTTCNNEPHCTFPRNSAVVQCEEFDPYNSLSEHNARKKSPADTDLRHDPGTREAFSAKGLCSNCDNLSSCTYPKPEGGVWHCEEYR